MAAGMLVGGLSCLICGFLPAGMGQAALAAIGKVRLHVGQCMEAAACRGLVPWFKR